MRSTRKLFATAAVALLILMGSQAVAMEPVYVIEPNGNLPSDLASMVTAAGGTLYRTLPDINFAVAHSSDPNFAANLMAMQGIRNVEEDVPLQLVPDPPQWGVSIAELPASESHAAGLDPTTTFFYPCQWNLHQIDAAGAWAQDQFGDPSVKVAVLDSGIDTNHIEFQGKVDLANSASFLTPGSSPCNAFLALPDEETITDFRFHGSFVAGLITGNSFGMASTAPLTQIVAVKVLACDGVGLLSDAIAGLLHVANLPDVDVVNMSFGASFPKSATGGGAVNAAFNKAATFAQNQGKLLVSSAGNAAVNMDKDRNREWVPTQSGGTIAAWAGDIDGNLAGYSNFGRSGTLVGAGGGDFTPTTPLIPIAGCPLSPNSQSGILSVCSSSSIFFGCGPFSYLSGGTGTSFSSPLVAGVGALVDGQSGGSLGPGQVKTTLKNTADDIGANGTDVVFSHGRVNASKAVE